MPPSAGPYGSRNDFGSSSLIARHPKRRGVALSCAECRRYVHICRHKHLSHLLSHRGLRSIQAKTQVNIPLSLYSMFVSLYTLDVVVTFLAGKFQLPLLLA